MRHHLAASSILTFLLLLGAERASAQRTTLDIKAPPTGSLSTEQLQAVAADIRRLEADPLASDAEDATKKLFQWAIDSPDISVSMCTGVISDLVTSKSEYHATLLAQFILSSAAYAIENPKQADNDVKVNVGGLEGVITTYKALKEGAGESAADTFGEQLLKLQEEGKLEAHVVEGLKEC